MARRPSGRRADFEAKRFKRANGLCWTWIGGVSSTGHGSFRAASLPGPSRRGTVPAHLLAYQLAYGVIPRLGWSGAEDAAICHQCDFAGCTNPAHMRLGTNATNRAEYFARRKNVASPLADVRGAAGRSRAIAAAIRTGLEQQEDSGSIERRFVPPKLRAFPSHCGDGKRYQPSYDRKHELHSSNKCSPPVVESVYTPTLSEQCRSRSLDER